MRYIETAFLFWTFSMLEYLSVKNFRSIKELEIKLTKLTVLIGANGSGKSNLVKLIEFIGDLPREGLNMAINKRGGREWMLPKDISRAKLKSVETELRYKTSFGPPHNKTSQLSKVEVDHAIKIKFKSEGLPYVAAEELVFHNVLHVAKLLENKEFDLLGLSADHYASTSNDSTFSIKQSKRSGVNIECSPSVNDENIKDYISWLGLPQSLEIKPRYFLPRLKKMWSSRELSSQGSRLRKKSSYSFVDENITTVLDFCGHYHRFRGEIALISRYDLLLNELRKEQNLSDADELMADGKNMPSLVKKIKAKEKAESWNRIKETFFAIAPHISQLETASLGARQEFVKFAEYELGRPVESWESSDGSLRALAVLLAIETVPAGATVIIEEPEQNLHPWAIRILMDYIVDMISKKDLQVIITTHSQQVLESAKPDEVLIASREKNIGTRFERLSEIHPDLRAHEIGDLWVKGLLGGVPKYD